MAWELYVQAQTAANPVCSIKNNAPPIKKPLEIYSSGFLMGHELSS